MPDGFAFELLHVDRSTGARRSRLYTPRGTVELPAFMPVATQATVKGLTAESVAATGAQILVGNTYHLTVRPGEQLIAELGGLHAFMGWSRPILTDSGGFQVFSLASLRQLDEDGVSFRSHVDGRPLRLTPEGSIAIQQTLGSDIAMALDDVVRLPTGENEVREAAERTVRWAARCRQVPPRAGQATFGIVQGGLDESLRRWCAQELTAMGFDGYAIGGLSVGEAPEDMYQIVAATTPHLPADQVRYLMGVGRPEDLLQAIGRGVDLFDCVMPTRNGRNALAFTDHGPLRMRNSVHHRDPRPIQADIPSLCRTHSRSYIRHLFMTGEMLGPILLSAHNLAYYQRLMQQARQAIESDCFGEFFKERMRGWSGGQEAEAPTVTRSFDD